MASENFNFEKKDWASGDVISEQELDRIETALDILWENQGGTSCPLGPATDSTPGAAGYAPAPPKGSTKSFLNGAAEWSNDGSGLVKLNLDFNTTDTTNNPSISANFADEVLNKASSLDGTKLNAVDITILGNTSSAAIDGNWVETFQSPTTSESGKAGVVPALDNPLPTNTTNYIFTTTGWVQVGDGILIDNGKISMDVSGVLAENVTF